LYGLSERERAFLLSEISQIDHYRYFNIDSYMHQKDDPRGEYGSIPYVTGHSTSNDASLLWLNSSDTWTELIKTADEKAFTNFVSESGVLELFIFASKSPKT
jgi:alpha 1,3-glucosidase